MSTRRKLFGLTLSALMAFPALSMAIVPQGEVGDSEEMLHSAIFSRSFISSELGVEPSLETVRNITGAGQVSRATALGRFFAENSNSWEVRWDSRADRANLIQGAGVPVLPGRGNNLTPSRVGLSADGTARVADVERVLRGFMAQYPEIFRISQAELRLRPEGTVNVKDIWMVEFQQVKNGVPVEGANVFFRINNGNIVQFGNEKIAEVNIGTSAKVTREEAFAAVLGRIGADVSSIAEFVNPGKLKLIPLLAQGERSGQVFEGVPGNGYRHALVWEVSFRLTDEATTYMAWVNARNGQILQLLDANVYATVTGGIYPATNTNPETVVGFPFTNVTNGTVKVTDAAGVYTYGSGNATATLNGKYIRMADNCGSISLTSASPGNLAFGTSGGTDCTTPGVGGAGNTHASRSGYYHLTNINRKAAGFLPTNTWLSGTLTSNMNINNTCNAFWNGSTVNFYRSGGGCSNTGEIAAVFLHEWGHGMDTKSGGAASDAASGEAVGDTFAFLEMKDPCIGPNFKPGVNCYNCNACTGVRDVDDFGLGGVNGGASTIAKPANVTANAGINCDRYACPYTGYAGPMGYQGHCESIIASSANWDLAQSLTSYWGTTTGWSKMDSIWYKSLTASKGAYRVASGGTCNPSASVDGCGSTNWYTVFLSADDNDGNLSNGTPNGCRIWDAFTAHGIACGTRPVCTQ